jgi:hypothetical protein
MKGFVLALAVFVGGIASLDARAQQAAPARELARNAAPADLEESRIERVTADLRGAIGTWTGVRSCSRAERAEEARKSAFEQWIGQQTLARPRKLLLVAGVSAGQWKYENRRRRGARSCKGWYVSAPVYAHFY